MSPARGPDGGPLVPVRVTPEDFHSVATQIATGVASLGETAGRLHTMTSAAASIAGVDAGAKQFDVGYQSTVATLFQAFDRAGQVLTDVAMGIDLSGANHWNADAAATPGGAPPLPWALLSDLYFPRNFTPTSLVGNPVAPLPSPLDGTIPMGHQTLLRDLSDRFTDAANAVDDLRTSLRNDLRELFTNNSSADLDALDQFWDTIAGDRDTAILTAVKDGCQQLAQAVRDFADWIVDTQNQIIDQIASFVGDLAKQTALALIPALLASLFTDGVGGLPGLIKVVEEVGAFGRLVVVVDGVEVAAAGRLTSTVLAAAADIKTAMSAAMSATPNPNLGPTTPQDTPGAPTDETEVQAAENIGDRAAKIDGLTPQQYQDALTQLKADAPKGFPITDETASQMLSGPPGSVPEVAGPGGQGADIVFKDADGNVVLRREVKTTQMNPNSFGREMSTLPKQVSNSGEGWFQVPNGTTLDQVYNLVRQFQQNRIVNGANLNKYDGLTVTFIDANGSTLGTFDPTTVLPGK